jgi:hypothetical protein
MTASCDDRKLWDLDVRPLEGYADIENSELIEPFNAEIDFLLKTLSPQDEAKEPKRPATPKPTRRGPNKVVVPPATAYTPGVLNCVRGSPPRRIMPKKPR